MTLYGVIDLGRHSWWVHYHCGLLTPYGDIELGQHWLRQWLVAWRHHAITWANVDLSRFNNILHETLQPSITKISSQFLVLKFNSNLPGANELKEGYLKLRFANCRTFCLDLNVFPSRTEVKFWLLSTRPVKTTTWRWHEWTSRGISLKWCCKGASWISKRMVSHWRVHCEF